MRRSIPIMLLLTFILMVGCSANPRVNFANIQDTYIATVQTLALAHLEGDISHEDWTDTVFPLILAGNQLLDDYDNLQRAGITPSDDIAHTVLRILAELQSFIE